MNALRSSTAPLLIAEETTPKPASAVSSIAPTERAPESSRRVAERTEHLLDYFSNPSPEMREMDAAWEEALLLYGDEDSDAWVSALEDGTHPLCRVRTAFRPA